MARHDEPAAADGHAPHGDGHGGGKRRDFLTLLAGSVGLVGLGAFVWPFIDSLSAPDQMPGDGPSVDVDVTHVQPGTQMSTIWRGKPILIVHRTPEQLITLQSPQLTTRLLDPESMAYQQPLYATNWHRSLDPQYGVMVGICTHLGCVPNFLPKPSATDPVADWPGGYLCPCHGSRYDLAGRVMKGSPARYNLPVPPYSMPSRTVVRIGQSPDDLSFDFDNIKEL